MSNAKYLKKNRTKKQPDITMQDLIGANEQHIIAAERLLKSRAAAENLIPFAELMFPDPEDPEDPNRSQFAVNWHHAEIAKALEELEKGTTRRLIITLPPRHGKSELCTRLFPAWFAGKNPGSQVIVAGYSETFATEEYGTEIRGHMRKAEFNQIFPNCAMDPASKSSSFMKTSQKNKITITGIGGKITGKGADLLIIDDPIKNDEQADSRHEREKIWNWYAATARSRLMPGGRILIVMTRWHEDDLVGRLLDPEGPAKENIKLWKVIHMPAIENEGKPGQKALWPAWYPVDVLQEIKKDIPPRWWTALYQGRPTPEDGDYFKKSMFVTYKQHECPPKEKLRIYTAMDLAVSKEAKNDASCILTVGIDKDDVMWVLNALWERKEADDLIEEIVSELLHQSPLIAWGERGQIAKSLGPFLRKEMKKRQCWTMIEEEQPTADKQARSRSIRGRMSLKMVRFPEEAIWWEDAKDEMLKFPNGKNDDFVDALSLIGLGLDLQVTASKTVTNKKEPAKVGTIGWIKESSKRRDKRLKRKSKSRW